MMEHLNQSQPNHVSDHQPHLVHELYRETHPIPTAETTPASEAEAKRRESWAEFATAATFPP